MADATLEPWMLRADWREIAEPLLLVNLEGWPKGLALDPLPPLPLVGLGSADHPLAGQMDVLDDPDLPLTAALAGIRANPLAAGVLIDVLRVTEGLPLERALTIKSLAFAMLQGSAEHRAWQADRAQGTPAPPGEVRLERAGEVLEIVLDRPGERNAIDRAMRDGLFDALTLRRARRRHRHHPHPRCGQVLQRRRGPLRIRHDCRPADRACDPRAHPPGAGARPLRRAS